MLSKCLLEGREDGREAKTEAVNSLCGMDNTLAKQLNDKSNKWLTFLLPTCPETDTFTASFPIRETHMYQFVLMRCSE